MNLESPGRGVDKVALGALVVDQLVLLVDLLDVSLDVKTCEGVMSLHLLH